MSRISWERGRVTVAGTIDGASFEVNARAAIVTYSPSHASGIGREGGAHCLRSASSGAVSAIARSVGDGARDSGVARPRRTVLAFEIRRQPRVAPLPHIRLSRRRWDARVLDDLSARDPSTRCVVRLSGLGRDGDTFSRRDRGRAVGAVAGLFHMSRRVLERRVRECHIHNWARDPFSRGTYSYARVGGSNAAARSAARSTVPSGWRARRTIHKAGTERSRARSVADSVRLDPPTQHSRAARRLVQRSHDSASLSRLASNQITDFPN